MEREISQSLADTRRQFEMLKLQKLQEQVRILVSSLSFNAHVYFAWFFESVAIFLLDFFIIYWLGHPYNSATKVVLAIKLKYLS